MPAFTLGDPSPSSLISSGLFPEPHDLLVMCMTCGAQVGARCRTDSGRTTKTHSTRTRKFVHHVRWGFVAELTIDNDAAGLQVGDFIICQPDAAADHARVLYRHPDGYQSPPGTRIRATDLRFLGWETELKYQGFDQSPGLYDAGIL